MFYQLYELNHAAMAPFRAAADAMRFMSDNPMNPFAQTALGRSMSASLEVFERMTRRYGKPSFNLPETVVDGKPVMVTEEIVWAKPFCNLLHFRRDLPAARPADQKILLVAPMSGHYATLLRGTVEACFRMRISTSPTGSMPAWFRSPRAASISTITSTT